jgi:hypothetical protein
LRAADLWSISFAKGLLRAGPLFYHAPLQRVREGASRALILAVPAGVGISLPPKRFVERTI